MSEDNENTIQNEETQSTISKKILLLGCSGLVVLLIISGVSGYFLGVGSSSQDEVVEREPFSAPVGEVADIAGKYESSTGLLGADQIPTTFAETELLPASKVIKSLKQRSNQLIKENQWLRGRLYDEELQTKQLTEKLKDHTMFAANAVEERNTQFKQQLKLFLDERINQLRLSRTQLNVVVEAASKEFAVVSYRHRRSLSQNEQTSVISNEMVDFAACMGDAIPMAANSSYEERKILEYFVTDSMKNLNATLADDLFRVIEPCQLLLSERLNDRLQLQG